MKLSRFLLIPALGPILGLTLLVSACPSGKPEVEFDAILPLTGEASVYGEAIRKGIEVAAAQFQGEGNTLPYEIVVKIEDSTSSPETAVEIAGQLIDNAQAIIGGVTSDEALAMVPIVQDANRVLLSPSASSPQLSGIAPGNFFRIFPSSETEAGTMANFAKNTLKVDDVAILAEDNSFGAGAAEAFANVFEGEVLANVTFVPDGSNLAETVADVVGSESQTVYVAATGNALAQAIQALRDGGFSGQGYRILTTAAVASPQVLAAAGPAARNVYYTQTPFDLSAESEVVQTFVEAYRAAHGEDPDLYAALGYDSVQVLIQALRECCSGQSVLASEFLKGMRAISNLPGVTGSIQFRESGDVQQFVRIFFITQEDERVDFDNWYKQRQEQIRERQEQLQREMERLMREQ